jgi:hypothetical protein
MLVPVPNIIWFVAVVWAPNPSAVLEAKLAEVLLPIAVLKLTPALPAVAVSPTATLSLPNARAAKPIAVLAAPVEAAPYPTATLPCSLAVVPSPNAIAEMALALALEPKATAASAVAFALMPIAVAPVPGLAVAPEPHANSPLPAFWTQFAGALGGITVCACAAAPARNAMPSSANVDTRGLDLHLRRMIYPS